MEFLLSTINRKYVFETAFILLVLAISFHLIQERIEHARFPGGDEGSWMSVAAQVSRGEGYTTWWYEHPFLKPATLPRHDDYRYPRLVRTIRFGCRRADTFTQVYADKRDKFFWLLLGIGCGVLYCVRNNHRGALILRL